MSGFSRTCVSFSRQTGVGTSGRNLSGVRLVSRTTTDPDTPPLTPARGVPPRPLTRECPRDGRAGNRET